MENDEKTTEQINSKLNDIRKEVMTAPEKKPPALTETMIESVKGIGPWARFLSVMGFISVAFMLIGAAFMLGIGLFANNLGRSAMPNGMMIAMAVLYVIIAILYIFPSIYLWNTAAAVVRMKKGDIVAGMETALAKQKSFWKFVGIMVISLLVIYPIFIIGVLVFGAMSGLH
ncbi:MAG: hypothetical protein GXO69_05900 [Acidobacteria bacterium]|nr:hypothetical protein [Acidobacteriota bacterium]